jgi:hypothetical protein
MRNRFYSYTDCYKTYPTESLAKQSAIDYLNHCEDNAKIDGEWPEEVEYITWGIIMQATSRVDITGGVLFDGNLPSYFKLDSDFDGHLPSYFTSGEC